MKLLIIEDEIYLAKALHKGFTRDGYAVDIATDGGDGYELYTVNSYDLILLDLNLPTMDGLEILAAIREKDKLQRVLILSARGDIEDRIAGLDLGANDYLPKPFDFGELSARVRSLLRRSFVQESNRLAIGGLEMDCGTKEILVRGKKIDATAKEFALLEYLMLNRGRVVSAEELIEHVWDSDADYFSASIKVHISNLRRKIKEALGRDVIGNIRGQGYQIEADNEEK